MKGGLKMRIKKSLKVLALTLAVLLSFSSAAMAALPNNTIIFGGKAYDLSLVNDATKANEILAAFVAAGNSFVYKTPGGALINANGQAVQASTLPAVEYKNAAGAAINYAAGDGDVGVTTATLSSVTSTNGTISAVLSAVPTVAPVAADFTFTQAIGTGTATALTVGGFAWNATTKTASFTFTAVAQTAAAQSVVVAGIYKAGTAVAAIAFTVTPIPVATVSIRWLGHSAFLITTQAGTRIVTDPYDASVGYAMPQIEADLITVSHEHDDHNAVAAIQGAPQVRRGSGESSFREVSVKGIATFHDGSQGSERGQNTVFVFEFDGLRIGHLGDIGHQFSDQQKAAIGKLDVLLVPVGGTYTVDAEGAAQICQQIAPRVVIPMHYKTPAVASWPIEGVDAFLSKLPSVTTVGATTVTLRTDGMASLDRAVYVLNYN
jgi:L-ascorbate metabolism protein UlaG (beta-lactamase superfamily)